MTRAIDYACGCGQLVLVLGGRWSDSAFETAFDSNHSALTTQCFNADRTTAISIVQSAAHDDWPSQDRSCHFYVDYKPLGWRLLAANQGGQGPDQIQTCWKQTRFVSRTETSGIALDLTGQTRAAPILLLFTCICPRKVAPSASCHLNRVMRRSSAVNKWPVAAAYHSHRL